jgi:FkbM family methyltransferase
MRGVGWGWDTPEEEARTILRLLPPADAVLFDVGAHHGDWSATVLRYRREAVGEIHAFEPSPENCAIIEGRDLPCVTLVRAAISARAGTAMLYSDRPGSGMASLVQRDMGHLRLAHSAIATTPTLTLDDYSAEHGIDHIDFLKMDIEGHELSALQGSERLLRERRIRALAFEFGGCNVDSRTFFRDFWQLLTGHGYVFFRIIPGSRLLPIREYDCALESFAITNYVATQRELPLLLEN